MAGGCSIVNSLLAGLTNRPPQSQHLISPRALGTGWGGEACPVSLTLSDIELESELRPNENSSHSTKRGSLFLFCFFPLLVRGWGGNAMCNHNVLHMYSIYLLTLCLIPEKD